MSGNSWPIAATSIVTGILAAALAWHVSGTAGAHPDFAMTWQAAQLAAPYDQGALNKALGWGPRNEAAFAYPPTALPFYALFGLLSFRTALTVWAGTSGAAMGWASHSIWAPALLLIPAVLWALPGGQTSVIFGALLLGSILTGYRIGSGVLLGLALSLKPQLAMVLPFAFLLERRWTVLAVSALIVVLMASVSALVFGPAQWILWVRSLPSFLAQLESNPFWRQNEIAAGLPIWTRASVLALGAWLSARALRQDSRVEAFVMAAGTGLISAPHAMGYEFAIFAAATPALITRRGWSSPAIITFSVVPIFIWAGLPSDPWRMVAVLLLVAAAAADTFIDPPPARRREISLASHDMAQANPD